MKPYPLCLLGGYMQQGWPTKRVEDEHDGLICLCCGGKAEITGR